MAGVRPLFLVPFFSAAMTGAASAQDISVSERIEHYTMRGKTPEALLKEMQAKGPSGVFDLGRRYFAQADSTVSWSYQYAQTPAGCALETAEVQVETTYTYPLWEDRKEGGARLNAYWDRFLNRLEVHEEGHGEIARAAGVEIAKSLQAMPAQENCPTLDKAIKETADAAMNESQKKQRAYDRDTNHGETQGAWFDVGEAKRFRPRAAVKKDQ
jgi:predicted secreted Zn-dependent protease